MRSLNLECLYFIEKKLKAQCSFRCQTTDVAYNVNVNARHHQISKTIKT